MRRIAATLGMTVALALGAGRADALLVDLTEDQMEQAIAHGRETYERYRVERRPVDDLDPDYVVDRSPGGRLLVFTEFGSIALETRRYLAIGRRFSPQDLTPILAPLRGRIEIIVVAYGESRDFMRDSKVVLVDPRSRHTPKIWHVNPGLPKPNGPAPFVASGRYSFDARDIDTSAPAVVVLETADGREFRFELDLGRMR